MLSDDDIERINALQQLSQTFVLSPISPDDTTLMQASLNPQGDVRFAFLNLQDGSQRDITDLVFNYPALTNYAWRNSETLTFIGLDADFNVAEIYVNRTSGEVATRIIDPIPGIPLSLSPNGTRLLIGITSDFVEATEEAVAAGSRAARIAYATSLMQSPFDTRLMLHPHEAASLPPLLQRMLHLNQRPNDTLDLASDEILLAYFNLNTHTTQHLITIPLATALLSDFTWSQDGSRLAFARLTFDGIADIFRGGTSLATALVRDGLGQLPPAFNPLLQGNAVEVFDLSGATPRMNRLAAATSGDLYAGVSWSTDNRILMTWMQEPARIAGRTHPIYAYPQRGFARFYRADDNLTLLGDFAPPQLAAPSAMQGQFISPDEVIFTGVYGLSGHIYYYNRASGEFREISDRSGFYTGVRSSRLSRQLVFGYSSFTNPPELYRIGWDGRALTQLSFANNKLARINQVQVNEMRFQLASGAVREGFLIQPAGAPFPPANAPIVVWQEGGPGLFMANAWNVSVERPYILLPNFGISVLVVPLPGREGYGPEFYNALATGNNFGRIDIDESAEIARQMIAAGYTAPDRLGITGCSYGGYFASQSIVRHPDLYAAANPQCSLLDTLVEWQTGFSWLMGYLTGVSPTSQSGALLAVSPLYQAEAVRTPTLIFHGDFDFLPVGIAENFHQGIANGGTPVRMLRFQGEGHGLFSRENQVTAAQEQIRWFRQYLAGTP